MEKPLFSIVIPAYNEEEYLGQTLESLKKQNYSKQFEIIVVDNGSTDKTAEVARKYGAKIIYEPKRGIAFARQAGFSAAKGKIVCSTDADTLLPKNWLSSIEKIFAKSPKIVGVAGHIDFYDWGWWFRLLAFPYSLFFFYLTNLYSGANFAVLKSSFEKIGGFDLRYAAGEDTNLCQRLKKVGQVYRNPFLIVKTSARRYQKLGILGGLWSYLYSYFLSKIKPKGNQASFKSGSELTGKSLLQKSFEYLILIMLAFFSLVGILFKVNPVKAQTLKRESKTIFKKIQKISHKPFPYFKEKVRNTLPEIKNY